MFGQIKASSSRASHLDRPVWQTRETVSTHQVINLIGQLYFLVCILQRFIIILKENGKWSNGLHLYHAFPTSGHSKRFKILLNIHPCIQCNAYICTPTAVSTMQGDSHLIRSSLGQVTQKPLDTRLGQAGDPTSNYQPNCSYC